MREGIGDQGSGIGVIVRKRSLLATVQITNNNPHSLIPDPRSLIPI